VYALQLFFVEVNGYGFPCSLAVNDRSNALAAEPGCEGLVGMVGMVGTILRLLGDIGNFLDELKFAE
jgi:hypothetical protein